MAKIKQSISMYNSYADNRHFILKYTVYQYKNISTDSDEFGFTYTGQTKNEKKRHMEHISCSSTNRHMKAARKRGDNLKYNIIKNFHFSCHAKNVDTKEQESTLESFLEDVTQCEIEHTKLWPNGGYNIRDERLCGKGFRTIMLKEMHRIHNAHWDHEIKPAFQTYYEKYGEIWSVPQNYPVIGIATNNMREGGSYISPNNPKAAVRLEWLRERKWSDTYNDGKWDYIIKPALQSYYEEYGELWTVPKNYPVIGTIVNNMRTGCYISPDNPKSAERLKWLRERKWSNTYDNGKWDYLIQPALQNYYEEHGEIWSIPQKHPVIGRIVSKMRAIRSYIRWDNPKSAERLKWLKERKWSDSYHNGKWNYLIKPAFQTYYEEHGEIWSVPAKYPFLGRIVSCMRRGNYISPDNPKSAERLKWLKERKWSTLTTLETKTT